MGDTPARTVLQNGVLTLVALSLLGWGLILWSVANMSSPVVALMMPMSASWTASQTVAVLLMWSVMMGAMMLPSAIPPILAHRSLAAGHEPQGSAAGQGFLAGYLVAWTVFSLAATALQWGFQRAEVLSHMLKLQDSLVAGTVLIVAGLFQLTPHKSCLLNHCRTPGLSLKPRWRPGWLGAMRRGFDHGLCCIGCCWALMLVLFVGGAMSLTVMAALTLAVTVEKLAPNGTMLAKLAGLPLIAWGLWMIAGSKAVALALAGN